MRKNQHLRYNARMASDTQVIPASVKATHRGASQEVLRLALTEPRMTRKEIAEEVGCSPSLVTLVLRDVLKQNSERDLRDFQDHRADIIDSLALRVVKSITDENLQKATALQLITSLGILIDKSQLLRGQATSINVTALVDVFEALRAKREQ